MIIKSVNKTKTTYGFILVTQSFNALFSIILLIDFDFFNKQGDLDAFQVSFLSIFVFSVYIYSHFLKKHKEAIKKYKIS